MTIKIYIFFSGFHFSLLPNHKKMDDDSEGPSNPQPMEYRPSNPQPMEIDSRPTQPNFQTPRDMIWESVINLYHYNRNLQDGARDIDRHTNELMRIYNLYRDSNTQCQSCEYKENTLIFLQNWDPQEKTFIYNEQSQHSFEIALKTKNQINEIYKQTTKIAAELKEKTNELERLLDTRSSLNVGTGYSKIVSEFLEIK